MDKIAKLSKRLGRGFVAQLHQSPDGRKYPVFYGIVKEGSKDTRYSCKTAVFRIEQGTPGNEPHAVFLTTIKAISKNDSVEIVKEIAAAYTQTMLGDVYVTVNDKEQDLVLRTVIPLRALDAQRMKKHLRFHANHKYNLRELLKNIEKQKNQYGRASKLPAQELVRRLLFSFLNKQSQQQPELEYTPERN